MTQHANSSIYHRLLLIASLAAIAFLYIYRIGDKALDFDERYSMNIATGIGGSTSQYTKFGRFIATPLPGATFTSAAYKERSNLSNVVSTAMNDNGQGLPYFIILHGWMKTFGISVFVARLPSAIFMLASIALFYPLLIRWRLKPRWALAVMLLFACNGVVIGLAQYLRFYSLGVLLTVISTRLAWQSAEKSFSKWYRFLLGLLWGLMLLNQFFSIFIIAAQGFYLLSAYRRKKPLIMALPIAIGLALPAFIWLIPLGGWESLRNIYVLHQSKRLAIPGLIMPSGFISTSIALAAMLAGATGQPAGLINTSHAALQILPGLPALLLIGIVIARHRMSGPTWMRLSLWGLLIYSFASVAHAATTGYNFLFQGRYWVFAYMYSYALLAWAFEKSFKDGKALRRLAIAALCLISGRAIYTTASAASGLSLGAKGRLAATFVQPYEDYEGVANTLVANAKTGDTISYNSWIIAQRVNWFLLRHRGLVQRVDSLQPFTVMITHGLERRQEIPIGKGWSKSAQPLWRQ